MVPRLREANPQGPIGAPPGEASPRESLIVLTRDGQLLETLRRVASGHAIHSVDAEESLAAQLIHDQGGVAVIDAAATTTAVDELTGRLKEQFPDLVMVVAGDAADQAALATRITDGTVYRFLHKPVSEQRVGLFVAAAWRRHGEEHAGIVGLARTQPVRAMPARRPHPVMWAVAAAVIALTSVLIWRAGSREEHPPVPVAAPSPTRTEPAPAVATSEPAAQPPSTVAQALPSPNAAAAPRAAPIVRTPVPAASRARADAIENPPTTGMPVRDSQRELTERILVEARAAIDEGKAEESERLIELAAQAGAPTEALEPLVRDAREARIAAKAATMARLSQLFNDRLQSGRLLEPVSDSAKYYWSELARAEATHPSTQLARGALAERFASEARAALDAGDGTAAARWLGEAREAGAGAGTLAELSSRIAAAETPAKPPEPQARTLVKIHHEDPRYPASALSRNAVGWVDVAFTVRAEGSVADAVVLRAQPAGLFDQAALDAVSRWRYEPAAAGEPADQRTTVRIRFELN